MGTIANLNNDTQVVNDGLDAIVIQNDLADIPGGVTLDCSGNTVKNLGVIKAGHVIVKTPGGVYKPLAIDGTGYGSIGNDDTAVGILKKSVTVKQPLAAVLTIGQVNAAACPYTVSGTIKSALPHIYFV
jgi:hypothetical protein